MNKAKIIVVYDKDLNIEQKQRLEKLGDVTFYNTLPESGEEYLQRVTGADVICSSATGLQDVYSNLRDTFVTVSFVSVAFLDLELMAANNVKVANSPGINRHAVTEWIIYMALESTRRFSEFINQTKDLRANGTLPDPEMGLTDRQVTILGHGNVANQTGRVLEALDAKVSYFKRGEDLYDSVAEADIVVDTLSSNTETEKLLNGKFFASMKKGAVFISVARGEITDEDALINALDSGHLSHAFTDCGATLGADTSDAYYKKLLAHPKITVTPHIAFNTEMSMKMGNDVMVDNVEAWLNGNPQNLLN